MATKPEFLVAKEKMLVALATVSVAISCPVGDSDCLRRRLQREKCSEKAWFFLVLILNNTNYLF